MASLKNPFWNSTQRRPRALWRLALQIVVLLIILLPLEIIVGLIALGILVAQEGLSLEQLDPGTLTRMLTETPSVLMLSTLALFVAVTVSVWGAGRLVDRRRFADFGLHLGRDWWVDLGFGLALGGFLMTAIFLIELAAGWVTVTGTFVTQNPGASFIGALLLPLVTFLAVGFHEELFSRGYQLRNLAEGLNWGPLGRRGGAILAALLSAAVFGLLHINNPNASAFSTFNIFVVGVLMFGLAYLLTGELAIPIGLHIAWNFFQGNVYGFPVSGNNFRSATFVAIKQRGPDLWTGGAFGPEAGMLGLGATVVGAALIVAWVRLRRGRVALEASVTQPSKQT
jgi:membrane protease YdiL (CAAX protease family)